MIILWEYQENRQGTTKPARPKGQLGTYYEGQGGPWWQKKEVMHVNILEEEEV